MMNLRRVLTKRAGVALAAALCLGLSAAGCSPQGQGGGKMTEAEKARFNDTPTADQTAQMQKMRAENQGKLEAAARAAQPTKP